MEQPKLCFILHGLLFDDFPIFQVMCSTKSLLSQYHAKSLGTQSQRRRTQILTSRRSYKKVWWEPGWSQDGTNWSIWDSCLKKEWKLFRREFMKVVMSKLLPKGWAWDEQAQMEEGRTQAYYPGMAHCETQKWGESILFEEMEEQKSRRRVETGVSGGEITLQKDVVRRWCRTF